GHGWAPGLAQVLRRLTRTSPPLVPAKAGTQRMRGNVGVLHLDSRFRGNKRVSAATRSERALSRCANVRQVGSCLLRRSRIIPYSLSRPQTRRPKRVRKSKTGRLAAAPLQLFTSPRTAEDRASVQFGTAAFGLGGKAASLTAPRSRSIAILSALSS